MTVGNVAQQAAITHNLRNHVGKAVNQPGMTRREQQKQLKRKSHLAALTTLNATVGAAGLGTFAASRHPHFVAHKPQLEAATIGLGAVGGGLGAVGGFRRSKIERRDIRAQKQALGVNKGMPDQSVLHVPTGLLKSKAYTASALRTTPTGKLVRVKAGVR